MSGSINRREMLARTGAAAAFLAGQAAAAERQSTGSTSTPPAQPFRFCLNTGTIRGQKLPVVEQVGIAAKAGYQAIEPWINELDAYTKSGGSLPDLRNRIEDAGLSVPSAIGFSGWIVDDEAKRRQGLEAARRDMDLVRQLGGQRIAAPPAGLPDPTDVRLLEFAQRYRALLNLGQEMGVVPQLEVWGWRKSFQRLSEVTLVAMETGHPDACLLADVYHLYKGGSDFHGLRLLGAAAMHVFHLNDYPAEPPRGEISDAHRIFPGDGVAPLSQIIRTLQDIGFRGFLSLELFNRDYWQQDPLTVAKTGLEKMQAVVQKALG